MLKLYSIIIEKMPPTPSKFHYMYVLICPFCTYFRTQHHSSTSLRSFLVHLPSSSIPPSLLTSPRTPPHTQTHKHTHTHTHKHRFNLRDLSRVYEGLCNAGLDVITTQNEFVRLWRHECDRVFCDRLTTVEDRDTYLSLITTIITGERRDCVVCVYFSVLYCNVLHCIVL
jgi:AAA+ lid domain